MAIFAIGGNGLERIGGEAIAIYPGACLHLGCSSSPDPVWVESVGPEWVTYYRYPYTDKKKQRERKEIFRHLVQKGTATKLKALERYSASERGDAPEWCREQIEHYKTVLAGREGRKWDRDDIRMVRVVFTYKGEGDGWSEFERYFPNSISGSTTELGQTVYESYDFSRKDAAELCHQMNIGTYPGFEYLRSEDRD